MGLRIGSRTPRALPHSLNPLHIHDGSILVCPWCRADATSLRLGAKVRWRTDLGSSEIKDGAVARVSDTVQWELSFSERLLGHMTLKYCPAMRTEESGNPVAGSA